MHPTNPTEPAFLQGDAFLSRLAAVLGTGPVIGGQYCWRSRRLTELRLSLRPADDPDPARRLSEQAARQLAILDRLHSPEPPLSPMSGRHATPPDEGAAGYPIWLRGNGMLLGLGRPTGETSPVIACSPSPKPEEEGETQQTLGLGLAYLARTEPGLNTTNIRAEEAACATLQVLSIGCLVLDGQCHLLHDGRGRTGAGRGPWQISHGRVSLPSPAERGALQQAVQAAVADQPRSSLVPVTGPDGQVGMAAVTPLAHPGQGRLALVLFDTRRTDHGALRRLFFKTHALTRSESLIAHEVLEGHTPTEMAENTGLSVATVRSYLKQVLAKTGTHRQSELVALYYSSIIPVGAGDLHLPAPRP